MKIIPYLLFGLLSLVFYSCNDELDIKQDYSFNVKTLPLPKKLERGESVALEFSLIREGNYKNTQYSFRYFQPDGEGILTDHTGRLLSMNRLYPIAASEYFTLLYQSACTEAQQLDFVFVDSFGHEVEYSVSFQNNTKESNDE